MFERIGPICSLAIRYHVDWRVSIRGFADLPYVVLLLFLKCTVLYVFGRETETVIHPLLICFLLRKSCNAMQAQFVSRGLDRTARYYYSYAYSCERNPLSYVS